ncbi:MAG TPA: LTA synthase family protein [Cyclobacteriaceae bacterium]|nr:LTA synthase family protein [Cyclobacteriaceae bacterium]
MRSREYLRHILVVLIYRIFIVMVLFTLCRIGFYLFNHSMFPGISPGRIIRILSGGFVFDLSGVLYLNLLIIIPHILPFDFRYSSIYQAVLKYLFLIINSIALALNCADFVYYRFMLKRATAEVFKSFANEQNIGTLGFRFIWDYWPATLLCFGSILLMGYAYKLLKPVKPVARNRVLYNLFNFAMFLVIPGLVVGGLRGGFRHSTRPITISNAARYVEDPRDVAIVLNTPFSIIRTWNKKSLRKLNYFSKEELTGYFNPVHKANPPGSFREENVVIIILESFSREYIGSLNRDLDNGNYPGYTPFMDSLISVGKTYSISLANGHKSLEAVSSVLASLPSIETPFTLSHYANNTINGMAELLATKGYYTAFFHGAPNGSMGFDSFARMAGFRDYFGMNEYPHKEDFDSYWGIWDEPFFQFFGDKISSFKQPFFTTIFSVSSHHPFNVPEKYSGKFKSGPVPILETIGYTDNALKQFFRKVEQEHWFRNTLFVITADHTNQSFHEEYQNDFGYYSIPIVFYKAGSNLTGIDNKIAQQLDIMPTVLNYLGYDRDYIAFGNNLFSDSADNFSISSAGGLLNYYKDNYLLQMLDGKTVGLYNFIEDRFVRKNLVGTMPELQAVLETKVKAILQTHNERMIDNDLVVK